MLKKRQLAFSLILLFDEYKSANRIKRRIKICLIEQRYFPVADLYNVVYLRNLILIFEMADSSTPVSIDNLVGVFKQNENENSK